MSRDATCVVNTCATFEVDMICWNTRVRTTTIF